MITLRTADERRHERRGKREAWFTFHGERADPLAGGFGSLESLAESRLPPGAAVPRYARRDAEIITYVREGALAYEDSLGGSGVLYAGEFQRITPGRGFRNDEINASRTDSAHVFEILLSPSEADLEFGRERKRFSAAERRGRLCIIASPDARKGSLRIHENTLVYSALLDSGQHVVHELPPGRAAWLHVVEGAVSLGEAVLTMGDGAGVAGELAVSITAQAESELLLCEVRGGQSVNPESPPK